MDMRRHWGRGDYDDDDRYADTDSADAKNKKGASFRRLESIAEEASSSHEMMSHQAGEEGEGKVHDLRFDESDNEEDDHAEVQADPLDEFVDVPLHATLGALGDDSLMLNNASSAAGGGGKYRTVSIFGGVFDMPDPTGDDGNSVSSSSSDGFSDDEFSPPAPKRIAKKVTPRKSRIPATASRAATPLSPTTITTDVTALKTTADSAVKALDAVERQVNDLLTEFESSSNSFYAVVPMIFDQAAACFDGSNQNLASILMMEDLTLSC